MKEFLAKWVLPPGVLSAIVSFRTSGAKRKEHKHLSREDKILLKKNELLRDRHQGERCFILGAGSSVLKQDLKKMVGESVISVSNTFVHPDFEFFRSKYHVLPHILYGHDKYYPTEKIVAWLREMEEKTLDAEMFFHIGDRQMIESNGLFRNRVIHWNDYCHWNGSPITQINLAKVPAIWSVSEFAITVALFLGFEKIYLLGFDHDWFNGPLVYFYDGVVEKGDRLLLG